MEPTQSGEAKNFIPIRGGQGALCAHLNPRRLLDEHDVWSICTPLGEESQIGWDRLLDVVVLSDVTGFVSLGAEDEFRSYYMSIFWTVDKFESTAIK